MLPKFIHPIITGNFRYFRLFATVYTSTSTSTFSFFLAFKLFQNKRKQTHSFSHPHTTTTTITNTMRSQSQSKSKPDHIIIEIEDESNANENQASFTTKHKFKALWALLALTACFALNSTLDMAKSIKYWSDWGKLIEKRFCLLYDTNNI